MIGQFRRAALSVALNIAEGSGRTKRLDKRRFYEIARASVFECIPIIEVSTNQGYLGEKERKRLRDISVELGRMITALMKSTMDNKSP